MGEGANCVGFSTLTVSTTANGLTDVTGGIPSRAYGAQIVTETDKIRYRLDGTSPGSSTGVYLAAGSTITFDSWSAPRKDWKSVMRNLKVIRDTASAADAKLNIHWFD
jgi:hypothetical protein